MIYFRGCVIREKLPGIEKVIKQILDKSHINYRILDNEECCGSFLLRTGFKDDALELMKNRVRDLEGEKILVSCAGCYKTLKNDYKDLLGVELDVVHTSQLFVDLIKEKQLKPKKLSVKVCYHDPCHLGRHSGEYEAPRKVLELITSLIEMENIKENSQCCGAGGGVKSAYPEIALKLAKKRIDEALDTDTDVLVTSCSFCRVNLENARDHTKPKHDLEILDLSEIFLWSLN
jgi:Fe-S oxidoreductase